MAILLGIFFAPARAKYDVLEVEGKTWFRLSIHASNHTIGDAMIEMNESRK